MSPLMDAHGGTAGLVFEIAFLAVPILVFSVMAVVSSRRRDRGDDEDWRQGSWRSDSSGQRGASDGAEDGR